MARETWGQRFSNEERILFEKGKWSITEDGEKVWSAYFNGDCVDPVLEYNRYKLFEKGFMLYREGYDENSYSLFFEDQRKPIFTISGKNVRVKINEELIVFSSEDIETSFDTATLLKVYLNNDNQIGLSF